MKFKKLLTSILALCTFLSIIIATPITAHAANTCTHSFGGIYVYDDSSHWLSCVICGAILDNITPHDFANECEGGQCKCGYYRNTNHQYQSTWSIDDSQHWIECSVCGDKNNLGNHVWDNGITTQEATCTTAGTKVYTCNVCNTTKSETIEELGHTFSEEYTADKTATTETDGSKSRHCLRCSEIISVTTIHKISSIKLATTSYSYDGKAKTPSVIVKDSEGNSLKKDTDYTLSYEKERKNVGTHKVTVKFLGMYSGSKTLSFTIMPTKKSSAKLLIGDKTNIGAKSNKSISYTSSNKKIATVSKKGVITAKKAGTVTITVKSNGITQKITVTVKTPYVKITGTKSMLLKKSVTLKATTNTKVKIKWSSSNTKIATVSSSGKVTGQKAGTATIYAKITYKGKTYTGKFSVTVKKPYLKATSATIEKGKTCQISVQGGSGTITYKSSNKSIATVSSSGKVKGLKKGSCTITVKRNGYSMKFTVKVNVNTDKELLAAYAQFIVKNVALKNPSSYTVNNYIYRKSGSSYTVYVWYSAANGYGNMVDGWAMAQFDTEKSSIGYSVPYKNKYIIVYTGWSRPSTFDGYISVNAVQKQYDKLKTISYYSPSIY